MTRKQWLLSGFVAFTCLVSTAAGAGPIENYAPVTQQRLENPEPGNWMLYRRTYDGQGYSPLDQINTSNVKNLTPVWTFCHRRGRRPRGAADRQQRRDVRGDADGAGDRAEREDRR